MEIRNAARTVIIDENNQIALINVRDGEYYKIPGGGIEEGESEETAAKREALEESGCSVELIRKIGEQAFVDNNPRYGEMTHHSVCFLAKKISYDGTTSFDDLEQSNKMRVFWTSFDNAIKLFSSAKTDDNFAAKINERDYHFVLDAQKMLIGENKIKIEI